MAPENGFKVEWEAPLIASVVIISLAFSLMLYVALAGHKRQRLLLQETILVNAELLEATQRLEEEKARGSGGMRGQRQLVLHGGSSRMGATLTRRRLAFCLRSFAWTSCLCGSTTS